jgi:hypothetical protein
MEYAREYLGSLNIRQLDKGTLRVIGMLAANAMVAALERYDGRVPLGASPQMLSAMMANGALLQMIAGLPCPVCADLLRPNYEYIGGSDDFQIRCSRCQTIVIEHTHQTQTQTGEQK